MKSVKDIKAIVYYRDTKENDIVRNFLALKNKECIECNDRIDRDRQIELLKQKGMASKEVIILENFKGRFYQECPGSPGMICCMYRVLNTGFNCLYDCTYCYLNSYLNSYGIMQFINLKDLEISFKKFCESSNEEVIYRIGSGEFTDSLMMDEITCVGKKLIRIAKNYPNIMLELKTKSNNIGHLLSIKNKGNTVLSWSINTERNITRYEKYSATFAERLDAASHAQKAGYFIAFHFDPIIAYDNWQTDYKTCISKIFQVIDHRNIVWISLGCFRYASGFKQKMRMVFPDEDLTLQEMFPGIDGKIRYMKSLRKYIYQWFLDIIREFSPDSYIYLCMETKEMWEEVFCRKYNSSEDLEMDFSCHLKNYFLN